MEKTEAVRKMQEFIEDHLDESITMSSLAKVMFYSPWYSYRLFKEYIGLTPSDYVRKFRLSSSALMLRDNRVKIIDIALKYGYDSQDGYQRAFMNEFGINPFEFMKHPIPITLFVPYKILDKKGEKKMSDVSNVFITVVTKPKRKVIIKRGIKGDNYWDYSNEVGCDIWGKLLSMKSISGEPVCLYLPKKYIKPNTSSYVQGVEVSLDYEDEIPEGFDIITLPECKYLKFMGEPFKEEDFGEAIETLKNAIDKFNQSNLDFTYDSENPRIQLEPIGERGYIELLPVK